MNSIASRNKIQNYCWKSKAGYFFEIHCMTGWKVKFTWNDQNTNHFLENLKIVQLECEIFRVLARQGEIWYLQEPNKIPIRVSEVCVSAVYDLPSMYFISFTCSVGTTKFCQWKRKLWFYSWESCNKYTVATCIQFLFDNNL